MPVEHLFAQPIALLASPNAQGTTSKERDNRLAREVELSPADDADSETEYSRLADLAEHIATEIAVSDPDWCALAKDATELAQGLSQRCNSAI